MRSMLLSLLLVILGPGLTLAQEANTERPTLPPPAKKSDTVTIYLHYFFPNYCHGYYIGFTYTVPVEVPIEQAKHYLSAQGGASPSAAPAEAQPAPSSAGYPWYAGEPR